MSRFFTESLLQLEPYTPGEQLKIDNLVKLNANENPYPPAPGVAAAVAASIGTLPLYSDLTASALRAELARHFGVPAACVLVGNGSDENLLLALRAYCDEDTPLAYADITYSFYPVLCDLMHIPSHILPLREDYTLDLRRYHNLGENIAIANPNAPTGLLAPLDELEAVVRTNSDNIVLVDEAYIDFAPAGSSCVPLTQKYENLIVIGTYSKSHNLAGARLGYTIANPALIADMNRIKFSYSPYNVNSMTQAAGTAAMADEAYFEKTVAAINAERENTAEKLRVRGFDVPVSATNFLFAAPPKDGPDARQIFEKMRKHGVLIRYFGAIPRLENRLRITIGTPAQMQRFFEVLDKIMY